MRSVVGMLSRETRQRCGQIAWFRDWNANRKATKGHPHIELELINDTTEWGPTFQK